MVKGDVKSAFKLAPIHYKDLECLGILFEGEFYIYLTLPLCSFISWTIFEDITTLIHWIFEQQTHKPFLHYLDDYFMFFKKLKGSWVAYTGMKAVASDIGLPLSPEKMVPPTQFHTFLSMGIDPIRMLTVMPQDKKSDILQLLLWVIAAKKVTAKDLQSLAGKLNFITKAVLQGRACTYQLSKTSRMTCKCGLCFWKTTEVLHPFPALIPHTSANIALGWGTWCGNKWIWRGWEQAFFLMHDPSIDILQLYAVVIVVFAWSDLMANKHVLVHSDNTPTVE